MKEEYSNQHRRWYDKDPVLSMSMRTLSTSDDSKQIAVALNLIKVITIDYLPYSCYSEYIIMVQICIKENAECKRKQRMSVLPVILLLRLP